MGQRHLGGGYDPDCTCGSCMKETRRIVNSGGTPGATSGGTFGSTAFRDVPQRSDPSVTNTFFNSGPQDGAAHGHVKSSQNPDGSTNYLYARDVEGTEYDV